MRNQRNIRTTNEGRGVQITEKKPVRQATSVPTASASNPLAAQLGKSVVDHLNKNLPPPKNSLSLRELVEKSQKEAFASHKIGKGISKEWVDAAYGGISKEMWHEYTKKFNEFLIQCPQSQQTASIKSYPSQYLSPTQISAPPGCGAQQPFNPVVTWTPPATLDQPPIKGMAANIDGSLAKMKIIVDPTIPEDVMFVVGADGKPVVIQLW